MSENREQMRFGALGSICKLLQFAFLFVSIVFAFKIATSESVEGPIWTAFKFLLGTVLIWVASFQCITSLLHSGSGQKAGHIVVSLIIGGVGAALLYYAEVKINLFGGFTGMTWGVIGFILGSLLGCVTVPHSDELIAAGTSPEDIFKNECQRQIADESLKSGHPKENLDFIKGRIAHDSLVFLKENGCQPFDQLERLDMFRIKCIIEGYGDPFEVAQHLIRVCVEQNSIKPMTDSEILKGILTGADPDEIEKVFKN